MKATIINDSEISELKVSSLPTRPTAPKAVGGMGYGAREMKEAFDRLPLFIAERFNSLIEDIEATGAESLAGAIKTGRKDSHTLYDLFEDIKNGELSAYLLINGAGLSTYLLKLREDIDLIKENLELDEKTKEDACQE